MIFKIKIVLVYIVLSGLTYSASAQNIFSWEKWLGDTNTYESGHSVKQFPDGSIYILGHGADTLNNALTTLTKLDSLGNVLWLKRYGNVLGNPIGAEHLIITKDNKLVTVGVIYQQNGDSDYLLSKLDTSGVIIWQNLKGNTHRTEFLMNVEQTADFGYIACGYISQLDLLGNDIFVVKYNVLGDVEWTKQYGGTLNDVGNAVHQSADGNYVIAGETKQTNIDNYLIKLDASGTKIWDLVIGDNNENGNLGFIINTDGDFILVGESTTVANPYFDIYLVKVSAAGLLLWTKYIGGQGTDAGFSIVQNSTKEYIITGYSNSYDNTKQIKVMVCKTDSLGNEIYTNYYGGDNINIGYEIIPSTTGGCLIVGFSLIANDNQTYLLKINEDAVTSIEGYENVAPQTITLSPNPSSKELYIGTDSFIYSYTIYDAQGNKICEGSKVNSTKKLEIDISSFSEGLYFINIYSETGLSVGKFVKVN